MTKMAKIVGAMLVLLAASAGSVQAQLFLVNASGMSESLDYTVEGSFEYDGDAYSNWNLTAGFTDDPEFPYTYTYTPETSSFLYGGELDLILAAPGYEMWLTFGESLNSLDPWASTSLSPGLHPGGGSYAAWEVGGRWTSESLQGTVTRQGTPEVPEPGSLALVSAVLGLIVVARGRHRK